jgi:hypothetical protein
MNVIAMSSMLPENHTEAHITQAAEQLVHAAKTEHGATRSIPMTDISKYVPDSRILECDGFSVRYTKGYDCESNKVVARVDMLIGGE